MSALRSHLELANELTQQIAGELGAASREGRDARGGVEHILRVFNDGSGAESGAPGEQDAATEDLATVGPATPKHKAAQGNFLLQSTETFTPASAIARQAQEQGGFHHVCVLWPCC